MKWLGSTVSTDRVPKPLGEGLITAISVLGALALATALLYSSYLLAK